MANLQKIQHLTLIKELNTKSKAQKWQALYKCVCGKEVVYEITEVKSNRKTACGCMRYGENNKGGLTHGLSENPLYDIHRAMLKRCYDPSDKQYKDYGGRGITVCQEWHDLAVFISWAEFNGYAPSLQLDREINEQGYSPRNCRFVTRKVNCNNRRDNFLITHNNRTQTLQQWADELGMKPHTLRARIVVQKLPITEAFTKPSRYKDKDVFTK